MPADKRFTLTEQHLALLRRAYVGWDDCEFGAPAIDCKRPYGNSSVVLDIAEILGVPTDDEADDYGLNQETEDRLTALHKETQTALQVILSTGKFEVGNYESYDYGGSWKKV